MLKNRPPFGPAVPRAFYAKDVRVVARELLGLILVRRQGASLQAGRIVEVEAYGRQGDRASHATSGKTPRNAVMFGPPGHAYVYFTYGMHWLLNVVAERAGKPAAVLLRGVELLLPKKTLILGPARLAKAFAVTGRHNGEDLTRSAALWIAYPRAARPRGRILRTPRIGVDYAGFSSRWRRRFVLEPDLKETLAGAHKKQGAR